MRVLEGSTGSARWANGLASVWGLIRRLHVAVGPHYYYLLALGVLALHSGAALLRLRSLSGHDDYAYWPRIVEFAAGLRGGSLFPRWGADFNGGFGEPSFVFLPPVFYYVSSAFFLIRPSLVVSENLATLVMLCVAALAMYALANEFFGPKGALVSAAAYVFAPYFLVNLYVRHALSDFSAFAFLPLAFWGTYRFTCRWQYRYLLVGAGAVAGLLLTSNHVSLMTAPFLALLVLWVSWQERSWRSLLRGAACGLLGAGLAAFFWLPAFAESSFIQLYRVYSREGDYRLEFVYPLQLLFSRWGYGLPVDGVVRTNGMTFAAGWFQLLLLPAALIALYRFRPGRAPDNRAAWRAALFFLFVLAAAAFMSTDLSAPIWSALPLLTKMQFPWRFLSLVVVGMAFICALPLLLVHPRYRTALMLVLLAALEIPGLLHAQPNDYYDLPPGSNTPQYIATNEVRHTWQAEYTPVWVSDRQQHPASQPLTLAGDGSATALDLRPEVRRFAVDVPAETVAALNTYWYPGWRIDVDGAEVPIDHSNPRGVMEFRLQAGRHLVTAVFGDTPVRFWSARASLGFLGILLLLGPLESLLGRRCR